MIGSSLMIRAGLAIAVFLSGFYAGTRFERSGWVDDIAEREEKATALLEEKMAEAGRVQRQTIEVYQSTIKAYQSELQRRAEEAERSKQVSARAQEVADELRGRLEDLRGQVSGRSSSVFDPDDVRLLNDAIEAANSGGRDGVP